MAIIKKNRYNIRFKAYITYQYEKELLAIFLEEHYDKIYRIRLGDNSLDTGISKELADFIVSHGGTVEKVKVLRYRGKKKIFGIPIEVKNNKNELVIRLVGKTKEKLSENIEDIKKELLKSGVKPTKVCSWKRLEDFDEGETDDEDTEDSNEDKYTILEVPHILDSENTICPNCKSDNLKELLQTSNGNRMKCLDCDETFVD